MISQYIRNLDKEYLNKTLLENYFSSKGVAYYYSKPQEGALLVSFKADNSWCGLISLFEWFSFLFPQSSSLARMQLDTKIIFELFVNCNRPLTIPDCSLNYYNLSEQKIDIENEKKSLLTLDTPTGKLWLTNLPVISESKFQSKLNVNKIKSIPFIVDFFIGESLVSADLLKNIQLGDLLLINKNHQKIAVSNFHIGNYVRQENYMIIENSSDSDFEIKNSLSDDNNYSDSLNPLFQRKIPISISFILQRSTITLAELELFFKGQVLPCKDGVEKNIMIQANGITIAHGELIWLEKRPAVVINRLEDYNASK